jgi:orotate phosphoribosyltransferase
MPSLEAHERSAIRDAIVNAVMPAPVTATSGRVVHRFVNGHAIASDQAVLALVGNTVAAVAAETGAAVLAGEECGAIALCVSACLSAMGRSLGLKSTFLRKAKHQTGKWTSPVFKGTRALIVDDVSGTGAAILRVGAALRAEGCEPVGAVVIVDREDGARALLKSSGIDLFPLVLWSEIKWDTRI